MCAAATDYNQDLKCEVLSWCTPLNVTFLLLMVFSLWIKNVHLNSSKTTLSANSFLC